MTDYSNDLLLRNLELHKENERLKKVERIYKNVLLDISETDGLLRRRTGVFAEPSYQLSKKKTQAFEALVEATEVMNEK